MQGYAWLLLALPLLGFVINGARPAGLKGRF
jgi:hypothetical protein